MLCDLLRQVPLASAADGGMARALGLVDAINSASTAGA